MFLKRAAGCDCICIEMVNSIMQLKMPLNEIVAQPKPPFNRSTTDILF